MKKQLILFLLSLCLISCSNVGDSFPDIESETESVNNDTTEKEFYETSLVDFSKDGLSKIYAHDGYSNGTPFGCDWSNTCVSVENGVLNMSMKEAGDIPYHMDPIISAGIAYRGEANEDYMKGFGYYSIVMKPAKATGTVSSFFTYSNENNNHNEIDIEFLGKNTRRVQFNYYVDNEPNKGHEHMHNLDFDYSEDFHKYGFLWTSKRIVWYIDDEPVYEVVGNVPQANQEIMSNFWPIDSKSAGGRNWAGTFSLDNLPLSMYIKSISYVPLGDVQNIHYYHYNALPATLTLDGCKEHWVNKTTNEVVLTKPEGEFVIIEDKEDLTYEEIALWSKDDIRIEPKYMIDETKLRFGYYPQTQVNDNTLKTRLKHIAGGKAPSVDNKGNWLLLKHYSGGGRTNKMFYQDVYDYETNAKYRGIYLLDNRSHDPVNNLDGLGESSLLNQSTQYKNGYYVNRFYWFRFDPIIWDINSKGSSIYALTTNVILDSFEFDFTVNSTTSTAAENKGDNNYNNSTLRSFLNNEFKNAAFIEEQLSFVKDHSINNEKDKITINSETNIYSFYPNETSRLKSPSRYALAMGIYSSTNDIYGHSMYWTKSASTTSYKAVAVNTNGTLGGRYVWYTNTGVLPSINLDIGAFDNV